MLAKSEKFSLEATYNDDIGLMRLTGASVSISTNMDNSAVSSKLHTSTCYGNVSKFSSDMHGRSLYKLGCRASTQNFLKPVPRLIRVLKVTICAMSSFMNQDAQRDVMYFVTDCLQFHLENAPSV
jgi:hypothetical protein